MKNLITLSIILMLGFDSYTQNIQAIKDSETIYFYGYDFTHFKLAEAKRMNDPVKDYVFGWVGYLTAKFSKLTFQENMNKKIIFDFDESIKRNKNLDDNLVTVFVPEPPSESIYHKIISSYKLKQSEGIGLIVFMEHADKVAETSKIRGIFFDIQTREILNSIAIISEASGTSMIRHWGKSFVKSMSIFSQGHYMSSGLKKEVTGSPCGIKPKKPPKFGNPQYKNSSQYKAYTKKLRIWRNCTGL